MVTIIIPVYNEAQNIPAIEQELRKLHGSYQVIFSDGGSTDSTFDVISLPKIREAHYRSNQMNAAARLAQGDYLWFVHADSILHKDSIRAIEDSQAEAGCFTLHFASRHPLMYCDAFFSSLRVHIRNIAFGDQGIFIRRSLFEAIGGYKPIPLMEDYQLSIDLKERHIGLRRLPLPIITSARRFERNGIIRTMVHMQKLQYRFRHGADCSALYAEYYGKSQSAEEVPQ